MVSFEENVKAKVSSCFLLKFSLFHPLTITIFRIFVVWTISRENYPMEDKSIVPRNLGDLKKFLDTRNIFVVESSSRKCASILTAVHCALTVRLPYDVVNSLCISCCGYRRIFSRGQLQPKQHGDASSDPANRHDFQNYSSDERNDPRSFSLLLTILSKKRKVK